MMCNSSSTRGKYEASLRIVIHPLPGGTLHEVVGFHPGPLHAIRARAFVQIPQLMLTAARYEAQASRQWIICHVRGLSRGPDAAEAQLARRRQAWLCKFFHNAAWPLHFLTQAGLRARESGLPQEVHANRNRNRAPAE
jgi:hypothetical protein